MATVHTVNFALPKHILCGRAKYGHRSSRTHDLSPPFRSRGGSRRQIDRSRLTAPVFLGYDRRSHSCWDKSECRRAWQHQRMSRAPGSIKVAFADLMLHVMIDDGTDTGIEDGI